MKVFVIVSLIGTLIGSAIFLVALLLKLYSRTKNAHWFKINLWFAAQFLLIPLCLLLLSSALYYWPG